MGIPVTTRQAAADAAAAEGSWVSLHTAAAGTTGANEATGGGYARQQTSWTPDGTGSTTGASVVIACAAGTYTEAGIFSTVNGTGFAGSGPFDGGDIVVTGAGAGIKVIPVWSA